MATPSHASQCNDGIDNDGDGTIDSADVGCATTAANGASSTDDDERVGLGFVPPDATGTSTSSNACSATCANAMAETCPGGACTGTETTGGTCSGGTHAGNRCLLTMGGGSYPNNIWSFSQSNTTLQYLQYIGYVSLNGHDTTYDCVRFSGRQIAVNGNNNTFQCFDAGPSDASGAGHMFKLASGVTGTTFQDGLIHDTINAVASFDGIASVGNNSATIRRVEFAKTNGVILTPGSGNAAGTGNTIELADSYFHDMNVIAGVHAEFVGNEGVTGGTIKAHHNRFVFSPDIDPAGDGGWTAGVKLQRTTAGSTALLNLYQNLFWSAAPLQHVVYTLTLNSAVAGACPGPANVYQNQFSSGTSGYFDTSAAGVGGYCGLCANGATSVYGNVNLSGASVSGPGGNCGSALPAPQPPILLQ